MRAALKPRRLIAVFSACIWLCSAAGAETNLKRITTPDAGVDIDLSAHGTVTGVYADIPSERMEYTGVGLLIGNPPDEQSDGMTVSGTPDVDVTLTGEGWGYGLGVYSWGESNDVTLEGGSIRATSAEGLGNKNWSGVSGLYIMASQGGHVKVRSTADITVLDRGDRGMDNNGVTIEPALAVYKAFYQLDDQIIPVTSNIDYFFTSERLHRCLITETDGSEPSEAYVKISRDFTELTFYDEEIRAFATAAAEEKQVRRFLSMTIDYIGGKPVFIPKTPLKNLEAVRVDGSGTAVWANVAETAGLSYFADTKKQHIYLFEDKGKAYIWERQTFAPLVNQADQIKSIEAALGGTISAEGIRTRGLNVDADEPVRADVRLLPGAMFRAKGSFAQGIHITTATNAVNPPTVTGGGNVTIAAESDTGCASGIVMLNNGTGASVSVTGEGNKLTVTSTTNDPWGTTAFDEDPSKASAMMLRPVGKDTRADIRFEGDVEVRGGSENGIYSAPMDGGAVRAELIGDLTLTDSEGDGIYQAFDSGSLIFERGKSGEIFLRGNLSLLSARPVRDDRTCAVKTFDGLILIDGDISVTGSSSDLHGVYADENAVVVVTGEITAPVPVRSPVGTEEWPNNARVYIWKTDLDACANNDDHIGFVLKIDEAQPALRNVTLSCAGEGNRFLTPVTWEGRTYYGAFAGDEITINGFPEGYRVSVTDADGNALEVTEKDGQYTFLTPGTCGALVSAAAIEPEPVPPVPKTGDGARPELWLGLLLLGLLGLAAAGSRKARRRE